MLFTEREKQALQLLVDNATDIDEDNGIITYFCSYIDEYNVSGFRGICSSLIKKNIICITVIIYCNVCDIPVNENYEILFERL